MTRTREKTALRCARLILTLVACTVLATAGCSAFDTTNNSSNTNNGNCDAAGGSNSVACSSAQSAGATAAASIPAAHSTAPTATTGTQLGKYTVTLPAGVYVPIGPSQPTRSQESSTATGDLTYDTFSGEAYFAPVQPFSTIAPYNGVPTYTGCSQDLNTQSTVDAGQGSSFCLFETQPARTVGGIVTYIDQHAINPSSVTVQLTIWSGTS